MTAIADHTLVGEGQLQRTIDWRGAFWVASGVPALVLFSIGGIAGTTGTMAYVVWTVSIFMGFLQSFTYAEIAGLFPNKSGGASIYGATAWLPYSKLIAPLSVWCMRCRVSSAVRTRCAMPTSRCIWPRIVARGRWRSTSRACMPRRWTDCS